MFVLLFAAHQGEEFVLILPGIMLVGAFIIMKWANQPTSDEETEAKSDGEEDERQAIPELTEKEAAAVIAAAEKAAVAAAAERQAAEAVAAAEEKPDR
jgi:hypothetical protein